jgi:condensin complex subunit 3
MLERLKDKVPEIRSQAVTALQRLQDPKDDECPIIKVSPAKAENHFPLTRK